MTTEEKIDRIVDVLATLVENADLPVSEYHYLMSEIGALQDEED